MLTKRFHTSSNLDDSLDGAYFGPFSFHRCLYVHGGRVSLVPDSFQVPGPMSFPGGGVRGWEGVRRVSKG